MAQPGRSWNDPKSARARAAGKQPAGPAAGSAGSSSPGSSPGAAGGGGGRTGWRDKNAPAVAQRGKSRHWLVSRTENPNRMRHRMKLAIAAAALLALIGYFLVTVLFGPRNTPLLLVGVLDYAAPLPPNAWTAEDFGRFRSTFVTGDNVGSAENIRVYSDLGERNWKKGDDALLALEQALADFDPGGPGKDTVLVYLSGHGILDANGRPCLVLPTRRGNDDIWRPQSGRPGDLPVLDLQEVLNTIENRYSGRDVKKVVLLDSSRMQSNPRLGILENRFGEALKGLQFKDENFFLLSSADAGQMGWVLPDLGSSAFGYFACKGLEGRADGAAGRAADDEVTLDELYQYLRDQIGQQVRARYMATQTPVLLPARSAARAADIRLTWSRGESTPDDSGNKLASPVAWERIDALWATHAELKGEHAPVQNESTARWLQEYKLEREQPAFFRGADLLSWEAFQQGLLRLEQLNDAGRHYTTEASQLLTSLEGTSKELLRRTQESSLSPALALRQVVVPDDVQKQVAAAIAAPPKTPEVLLALQKIPYEVRAKAVWNHWLSWARSRSTQIDVAEFRRTLDDVLAPPAGGSVSDLGECDPVEIRFLRLLDPRAYAPGELFADQVMALQAAILSRDLAEAAAWANEDVRVHYAVGRSVAQGDAERRNREDQVFFRTSDAATGQQWPEAEKLYKQALTLAVELSAALAARDQAWQDLPYLAQWLVLRNETEPNPEEFKTRLAACKQLFANNRQLAGQIDRLMEKCLSEGVQPDDESRKQLVAATDAVGRSLNDLVRSHRDAISYSNQAGAVDVLNRRRIHDLLTTPLLTGEDRAKLRQALLKSRRNMQALAARSDANASGKAAASRVALEDHPLVAFFAPDGQTSDTDGRLAGELRGLLKKRFDNVRTSAETPVTAATLRTDRAKLSTAEQAARDAAALWTSSPIYGDSEDQLHDPLGDLLAFDRHHAIVWQASRALDDFWGKEGDPRSKDYFVVHAELAQREARDLGPGDSSAAFKQLSTTLTSRQQVAGTWAQLNVPSVKLPPGEPPRTVEAHPAMSVDKTVPPGRASFLVKQPTSAVWQSRFAAPFDKQLTALTLPLPAGRDPVLESWPVALFYRGHVLERKIGFTRKEVGQRLVLARGEPVAPRVIVRGPQDDTGSVVFILDCSGTMGRPFDGVIPMNIAKPALRSTLQELSEAGTYRVALWLYGHRLGWNNDKKLGNTGVVKACEFLRLDAATRNRLPPTWCNPETDLMSEDVAREWPQNPGNVDKLTPAGFRNLSVVLDGAQGFGVTPLFYSIIKVLQKEPMLKIKDRPPHLIVLTDGLNNVNAAQQKPDKVYKFEDVENAVNEYGRGAKLHVIGFGEITSDQGDARTNADATEWRRSVPKIASYHEIRNLNESRFRELIRSLIGLKRYEVAVADQPKPIGTDQVNTEIILSDHSGRRDYQVRITGSKQPPSQLTLYGGEAINLYMDDAESPSPRLHHKRYVRSKTQDKPAWANLDARGSAGADDQRFYVGIHQPLREAGGFVNFPISIQNAIETQFSRRPAEAWVEITPLGGAASDKIRPLVFYDLQFESGRPVPVLLCRAQDWPAGAQGARINLFFKPEQTPAKVRQLVDEANGRKPNPNLDVSLSNRGSVQFTVDVEPITQQNATQITVMETCAREADLGQVKVEIETTGGVVADTIEREYFLSSDQQEVRHKFVYKRQSPATVGNYRVRITTREDLEKGAYKLDEPVEVVVGRQ